jgi:hypothetical protein
MNDTTAAAKPALPVAKPVQAKTEAKPVGLPILKIIKTAKDGIIDIENGNGTTTIKLDKYRIEVPSAVKINIK